MEFLLLIIVGAVLYYYFVMRRAGNLPFWKVVQNNSAEAYDFFVENPHWHIDIRPNRSVVGPFLFVNPYTGRTCKLYCDEEYIESTQREFLRRIE